ncbi:adenosylmethionine--8-amino-7-oxononanoate transaminase [Helicobacter bilis]|uniref:Adenosylmethionine-8-amino-7-oxononanoate aminotransferase n=1 Tax=Helicobacter bilis TaxID=37372 RepID=A0A4U8U9K1_9HELI|nr:adenosylmethionine--8-amino-7-oxononanoate transaminase [Helicobacter bilis]MCI7411654.1 adenosylmethionine--8-amino-7-oxononanoate transaminase [Helicobacter bilis]MDD7296685.1 adenosylmethionine--8-amino-7-oxononanoate transaminase [Helicobacter bilis]MDY4400013.1 adenosylmethionine--8-amino-7-oxononanoate transaminase [Helicobacter bilis]TLE08520.1 adenosylmethionine--8-amino-7-oxononanoate transaminase [Helicobacter bilis]TLE10562.1 adenosylmethionine--8-amino-7-oxononanoate transaminas
MQNDNLAMLDLAHIWHPCTQMKDHEKLPIIPIKRAKGIYLYDFNDKSYIDCVSSWWVNLFGHCNDYINAAIKEQLDNLEHVILAGFSHEPIINLSKRLCDMLPQPLNKCFYADNGSSAIEVALKMSFHYFRNLNINRNLFLSLTNSYHGETIGTLSVGDVALYKETYAPLLLESLRTEVPETQFGDYSHALESLEKILKEYGDRICAFILEPLIQCAGNMHMYNKDYIKDSMALCRKYGIQIIFDEIAVGFGRTGSMFALEQCGVVPDYLCLSKGISGGYMPLSVVITSDSIYDVFYAPYSTYKAFLHSHSYTGNTLACAAANAVLDIFQQENIIEKNKQLSLFMKKEFEILKDSSKVKNMRICGMVVAFDVITDKERPNIFIFEEGLKRGLLLRPLGNTIYFMPPYVITQDSISYVVKCLREIVELL